MSDIHKESFFPEDRKGTTETRPVNPMPWFGPWFDITIQTPIWYNGKSWIDASGTEV